MFIENHGRLYKPYKLINKYKVIIVDINLNEIYCSLLYWVIFSNFLQEY